MIRHNTLLVEFEIQQQGGSLEVISGEIIGDVDMVGEETRFCVACEQELPLFEAFGDCWDCGAGMVLSADPIRNAQVYEDFKQPWVGTETRDFETVLKARVRDV